MHSRNEMNCTDCAYGDTVQNAQIGASLWCRGRHSPHVGSFTQPENTCSSFAARIDGRSALGTTVDPEIEFKHHAFFVDYAES